MPPYDYLIVGGGMTADAAAQAIRAVDANGRIGLLSAEPHPPYNRPPLSKALWKGEPEASIWRKTESTGATLQLGRRVVGVDPGAKTVSDDRGTIHGYKKLLLATGGTPRRLPLKSEQVIYFRTYEDYRRLRGLAEAPVRFAVIGGGFIGTEIAAALRLQGRDVTMLVPEDGLGARVFPADLARFLVDYYRQKGVELRMGEGMTGLEARAGKAVVRTTKNSQFTTDVIVAGLGIQPNVELAEQAGLRVDNGIVVDDLCRTSNADIYAAGDVANFHNPALDSRLRVEHEDNANTMGRAAGRAMGGEPEPYHHLPFFYSDLFELGYEAVGDTDSRLETFSDWKEPFREGVVYYLKNGRGSAVVNLLAAPTRTLAGMSAVSAGVPQFREPLLASRERADILHQAQEFRDLIGAAWALVTNEAGILLARTDYPDQFDRDLSSGALVAGALSGDQLSGAWLDDLTGRLYMAVATPLAPSHQAAPQGVLVAAYALDDSVAQAIKQATTSDIVLFALDTLGRPHVVGSTLPREEVGPSLPDSAQLAALAHDTAMRSEERRVGKECRSRWSPYH